jgi:hypothetical protein
MRDAGSCTGFVGDLGLGFTKPVSLVVGFNGCGFLLAVVAVGRVAVEVVAEACLGSFLAAGAVLGVGLVSDL